MAAAISAFVTHLIFHPVISVRLDDQKGSYGEVTLYHLDDQQKPTGVTEQVKYFRLRIENTGLSSVKDCSGYITKLTKRVGGQTTDSEEEVLTLGWAHYGAAPVRDLAERLLHSWAIPPRMLASPSLIALTKPWHTATHQPLRIWTRCAIRPSRS